MKLSATALWSALALLVSAGTALADGNQWRSTAAGSELAFSAWYEGEELTGHFEVFAVRVELDEGGAEPVALKVEVTVDSADMKDREVNEELKEPDWFDAASFPTAVFASSEIRAADSGYVATGHLLLKGIDRPLEIPLNWRRDGDSATLSGMIALSRRDWQIGAGEWSSDASLSDRVELRYTVTLTPER